MASDVTSVQTPEESDDGKESTSVSEQPEISESEEEAELSVSKDELDCSADGVVESSDIAPVKVEIPEICANNQEILDAVSHVADSFNFKLKMQQEESIFNFIKGKDVFVSLPTGFGKSLCYNLLPAVFDILRKKRKKSIVLVVSPSIALMNDQVDSINAMGISAIKIGLSNTIELKDHIKHGDFQVLFISPENLVSLEWRNMLASGTYRCNLIGFVVDEAHCIQKW